MNKVMPAFAPTITPLTFGEFGSLTGQDKYWAERTESLFHRYPGALLFNPSRLDTDEITIYAYAQKRIQFTPFPHGEILLYDAEPGGGLTGQGRVRLDYDEDAVPEEGGQPYVSWTETTAEYKQGWGTKRAIAMNYLSTLIFDKPLHSDLSGITRTSAQAVWHGLVARGLAEAYDRLDETRYSHPLWRFKV